MWEYSRNCMNSSNFTEIPVTSTLYKPDVVATSDRFVLLVVLMKSECKLYIFSKNFYESVFSDLKCALLDK